MSAPAYEPRGPLALEPSAFGLLLAMGYEPPPTVVRDDVAIVAINGPLMHHADPFCDSYEAIKSRIADALESSPRALVLSIDSPGGLVSGCFSAARDIRSMAASAGVPLLAHVDGQACSAAYALACASERIVVSQTGHVGSIGIIDTIVDATAAAAQQGLRITVVGSGDRKADGNPNRAVTPEATEAALNRVRSLSEAFFAAVAESRPITVDEVRALNARTAHGSEAVTLGLADSVGTLNDLLASIAGSASPAQAGNEVRMDDEEFRKALKAAAEDEERDEESRARARRALAAFDGEDEDEEAEGDDGEEDPDAKAKAARGEGEPEDEPEGKAKASAAATLAVTANSAEQRIVALEKRLEAQERAELFASRPDITPAVQKAMANVPLAEVKAIVASMPKPKAPKPAAAAQARGTVGEGQGDGTASKLPPELDEKVNQIMGLAGEQRGVFRDGNKIVIGGVVSPKKGA